MMLYFGCWGAAGHFFFDKHGRSFLPSSSSMKAFPSIPASIYPKIDGGFAPRKLKTSSHWLDKGDEEPQGVTSLTHLDGWTILALWDRSVDRRPGSNSAFIEQGALTFDEMVAKAKADFGPVWARFPFEVRICAT